MLVRVKRLVVPTFLAEQLEGTVGNDFVGIHVGRGAGAALDDVHHELFVQLAVDDFSAGGDDGLATGGIEQAELLVGERGGLLDLGQGTNQVGIDRDRNAGDREVFQCAQGMHPVIGTDRDVAITQQIVFATESLLAH